MIFHVTGWNRKIAVFHDRCWHDKHRNKQELATSTQESRQISDHQHVLEKNSLFSVRRQIFFNRALQILSILI